MKRIGHPALGQRLKAARQSRGLKQSAVAKTIGVSTRGLRRWEQDSGTVPEETLIRLAELYAKPLQWFLTSSELLADENAEPDDSAWRIYQRVSQLPESVQLHVLQAIETVLEEWGCDANS